MTPRVAEPRALAAGAAVIAAGDAVIVPTGAPVPPFLDAPGDVQIMARPLRGQIIEALTSEGLRVLDAPPADAPYVGISDRTWLSPGALRRFMAAAAGRQAARLRVEDPVFLDQTMPLQKLPERGVFEVGLFPAGAPADFGALAPITVDLGIEYTESPKVHPAVAHAFWPKAPVSDAFVHQIDHWTHILRVNWLALSATICAETRAFQAKNPLVKAAIVARLLARARSLNPFRIAGAMRVVGKDCKIHPTAVIEGSTICDGVEIGPYAVIRGSWVGPRARIEEFASVTLSVVGEGARVGRRGTSFLCVLYPQAFIGDANGYQASVFGRESFAAWTTTVFDLAFDKHVKVWADGERVDSGGYFLGAAIGHRARIGGQVTLGYGAEVPNDAFVVGESRQVMRAWEVGPGPHRVVDGVARPLGGREE